MKKVTRSEQNVKVDTGVQVDTGAQVQVYTVMHVQTQYVFAVYCIVHKVPFWLDPPTTTTTYLFLRPRTSLTCSQKTQQKKLFLKKSFVRLKKLFNVSHIFTLDLLSAI